MKRIIALVLMLSLILLCACDTRQEVSHELIDYRYTPAHEIVETTYDYKYNALSGEFQLVPDTHTAWREDKYELLYRITYDDGSSEDIWEEVERKEYDNAIKEIGEESE